MQHKQKLFNGLLVGYDAIDTPPQHSLDLANVDTFRKGELNNMKGIEKQHTSAFDSAIIAIHQLNGSEFCLAGDKLYKL